MRCTLCNAGVEVTGKYLYCQACDSSVLNLTLEADYSHYGYNREKEPQINKDFLKYEIPEKIREKSIEIYQQVIGKDTLKSDRRRAMMCMCTYEAYKQLEILKDPILLAILYNVTPVQMRNACDDFYERVHFNKLTQLFPKKHISAKELLPEFLELLDIDDPPIDDLNIVVDAVYKNASMINRAAPRDIAICVSYWYNTMCDDPISIEIMRDKTKIHKATMDRILEVIEALH